jgi:capsular exopolysaccharide synthesis family protein
MEGKINIRALLQRLVTRWYYFILSMLVIVPIAWLFTEVTDKVYQVRSSILLNNSVKNEAESEKLMKEMDLLSKNTEIEDEIGILKSFDLVGTTVRKLDFGVSYFKAKKFLETKELWSSEIDASNFPFEVQLDSAIDQIVEVPVYIERTSEKTYSVRASQENVNTFNFDKNDAGEKISGINIHSVCFNDKPFRHENLAFTIKFKTRFNGPRDEVYYFVIHNLDAVTEAYQDRLEVKPISRESNIVELSLKGKTPKKEILFLNTLMDAYLVNEMSKRTQLGVNTIKFIDDQLGSVSGELQQVESSLESFRSRNNILDINATAENLAKNLDRIETEKSKLDLKLGYYQSISKSLKNGDVKSIQTPSTFGLEDPLLNNLLLEFSKLNQERIGLNYSAKEGNPATAVLDLKIANNKKAIMENVDNFISASTVALSGLNQQIAELQGVVRSLPRSERELVNLQRRFDFNDNVYKYLLEKRTEAGIAIASNSVEKSIVDRAKQVGAGPVFPNKKLILSAACVVALVFALGLVVVKDFMNDNIVTLKDIEKSTEIPFLGAISHGTRRDRAAVVVAHSKSELGESFRSLRVNLQYLTLGKEDNVIGVTSSISSEGQTFCSINLAAATAFSGRKTILIDADLRQPRIASSFMLNNEKGLSTYIAENVPVHDVIRTTLIKGLDVIPSGPIPANPLDLIGHPKMEELINNLKKTYNTIIFDSPPIGYVSEYIILMKYTNANIYVVRSNYTSRLHLEKINRLYKDKKISNVSILLNDAKSQPHGYDYTYR